MAGSASMMAIRMRLSGASKVQAQAKGVATSIGAIGAAAKATEGETLLSTRRIRRSLDAVNQSGKNMRMLGGGMTKGITLPLAVAAGASAKLAIDFEKDMRNVNSIAQLSDDKLNQMSESVLEMSGRVAQTPTTLANGLYDLVSSGFEAEEALGVLEASAMAATAGLTTAEVATSSVAAVLNAYRMPADQAESVSDTLFKTVDRGVISFEQLAGTIGDVLPFASSLGIGLEDVGASIATMTKAGIGPAETMTRIKALMASMLNPSKDLKKALEEIGYESGEAAIDALGFQGTLDALVGTTSGSKAEVAELFPNIRALGGALALTGDNAAGAAEDLAGMKDSAGATQEALEQQSQSLAYQWQEAKATAAALGIEVGNKLVPVLKDLLGEVKNVFEWYKNLSPEQRDLIFKIGLVAAALGPAVWMFGALVSIVSRLLLPVIWLAKGLIFLRKAMLLARIQLVGLFIMQKVGMFMAFMGKMALWTRVQLLAFAIASKAASVATWLLNIALLANPVVLIIVGLIALGVALVVLYKKVDWFRNAVDAAFAFIKKIVATAIGFIKRNWQKILPILMGPLGLAIVMVVRNFDKIKSTAADVVGAVKSGFNSVVSFIRDMPGKVASAAKGLFNGIKDAFKSAINWVIGKWNNLELKVGGGKIQAGPVSINVPEVGLGTPDIPLLRTGGLVTAGSFVAGEAGPELIDVAGGMARVRPMASLRSAPQALEPLSSDERESFFHQIIQLVVDGRVLAEAVATAGDRARARK